MSASPLDPGRAPKTSSRPKRAPNSERGNPTWQTALVVLSTTVVGATVVACLYLAQVVLIPVVLAVLLTFLLAPFVAFLQRMKLGRTPSVVIAALIVTLTVIGLARLATVEVSSLVSQLPTYTENIRAKVRVLRQMGEGATPSRLEWMAEEIAQEWNLEPGETPDDDAAAGVAAEAASGEGGTTPQSADEGVYPSWWGRLIAWLQPAFAPLGYIAMALVLSVFMLLKRESLRDRLIWIMGARNMTATTKAFDDAGSRISHYLLIQFFINASYGAAWGLGLYLFGLENYFFWGFLSAVLRYIPYLGAPIGAVLPLTMSLAQFPGWWPTVGIFGYVVVLELLSNNIVEPLLYGKSIGVSVVALLISALFWTLLWGPIGLVLSAPLTVCLMVLGRHVPSLNFLVVLLGDQPALDTEVSFYQRLVARDDLEAMQLLEEALESCTLSEVFDTIILPALVHAKRDAAHGELSDEDEEAVVESVGRIVEALVDPHAAKPGAPIADDTEPSPENRRPRVLVYPEREPQDRAAMQMLGRLLESTGWEFQIAAPETLMTDLTPTAERDAPALICICTLPPGGPNHTRYVAERLRTRFPSIRVVAGLWGATEDTSMDAEPVRQAGAMSIGRSIGETCAQINGLMPNLRVNQRFNGDENTAGPSNSAPARIA